MPHPTEAMNKLNFNRFRVRARASNIAEVHVGLIERRDHVTVRYNAREKKKGVINGEWTVARADRTPEQVDAAVAEFLGTLGKEFRVVRHEADGGETRPETKHEPLKKAPEAPAAEKPASRPAAEKADAGKASKKAAAKKPAAKKPAAKAKAKGKAKSKK